MQVLGSGQPQARDQAARAGPTATAASAARTCSGSSSATNSRARSSVNGLRRSKRDRSPAPLVGLAQQQPAQHVHRDRHRPIPDVAATAGHLRPARDRAPLAVADGDVDQADRFVLGAAAGPSDAGDPDPDLGLQPRSRTARERLRHLARNGPGPIRAPAGPPPVSTFAWLEYTTSPPRKYAEDPARSVSRAASTPPVHDSATATVCPPAARRAARRSSSRPPRTVCWRGGRG